MNRKDYAHILDTAAGMQIPDDLNLAPNILTRIQQRKGIHMQPRIKLFSAVALVVIVVVVLFSTVPGMAASLSRAIERWFGYVPGVGFVHEGQIRILDHPTSQTREGITVTVEQVVLDPQQTALVYSVEGIPSAAVVTVPGDQHCPYAASLRLPDGSSQNASPNGLQVWASGYLHRFYYPPISASTNEATLVISCLFNTHPGSAPENWEISLHFIPAPPSVTAFPIIEITPPAISTSTSQLPAAVNTPNASQTATANTTGEAEVSPAPAAMTLTLDRAVQMDDGYLIYAMVNWQDTPFVWVDVTDPTETLHLLDANGQPMLYELRFDELTETTASPRQTHFVIKTAPVQTPGPLALVLDSVVADLPVNASFVFDPGQDAKEGQTWALDQDVPVEQYHLRIKTVMAGASGYRFEMSSDDGIFNATLVDLAHPAPSGGGGGGGSSPGEDFSNTIRYADGKLPNGPVTVTVSSISVQLDQRLEAQWTPPAASTNLLPTQAAACLTSTSWKAALAQKPVLPDGIGGRVLTSGQDKNGKWGLTISNLDGSNAQLIESARDGSFSPDSSRLAYSTLDQGLAILDLATNQTTRVPGTGNGDFNPIWSPDGKQIVFMRGMGIFDLFMVEPDGSKMRQITHGGVQEWLVGWMPDGRLLYSVPGRENEYISYAVDLQSGNTEVVSESNSESISPDGKHTLTSEKTFGDRWLLYVSNLDGTNRRPLNDSSLWVLTPLWSLNGQWLLAGISDLDPGSTIGGLINLGTCEVIPLPDLKGNLMSWSSK